MLVTPMVESNHDEERLERIERMVEQLQRQTAEFSRLSRNTEALSQSKKQREVLPKRKTRAASSSRLTLKSIR